VKQKGGGPSFKTQAELIEDAKKRLANKKPLTEEELQEKERQKKIAMLRHKCGVGGRRTPNGGFFT
jgi:hypothetical protein